MKKLLFTVLASICLIYSFDSSAQTNDDVWYVWIDTEVEIENKLVRIVSEAPIEITCCVKSPEYRQFIKDTSGWIRENVSDSYTGQNGTKKIQVLALAEVLINEAKEDNNVRIIKYDASCK